MPNPRRSRARTPTSLVLPLALPLALALAQACGAGTETAPRPAAVQDPGDAVRGRRRQYTRELLEVIGRAAPEQVSYMGLAGFDEATADASRASDERDAADLLAAAAHFADERAREPDEDARTDLVILEDAARRFAERTRLSLRLRVGVLDVGERVYQGLASLLAEQADAGRRPAAQRRLARYLGEGGVAPIVDAAVARAREDLAAHKLPPTREEVRGMLAELPSLREASVSLAARVDPGRARALGEALDRWRTFLEAELLPAAREDFRLPPELYAMALRDHGIDEDPAAFEPRARAAYARTMAEWRALATRIAARRSLPDAEPAHVLAALKRERRTGPELQALFEQRIGEIEAVLRRERIVTVPSRRLGFRAATPAETALNPSPSIDTRGFLAGAREIAVIVPGAPPAVSAPAAQPGSSTAAPASYDDFTFDAAVWPLLVHEGRPGHEMQFTTAVARGLSPTRTLFAVNAVNLEGWALYCEGVMRPFMPEESRFVDLQYLLVRQARAFLDPGLHRGEVTPAEAQRVLREELGTSEALATSELRRYTFESPGQAAAYFVGLERFERLRDEVARAQGPRFDQARFHDAILHQGFAPLAVVASGVRRELGIEPPGA